MRQLSSDGHNDVQDRIDHCSLDRDTYLEGSPGDRYIEDRFVHRSPEADNDIQDSINNFSHDGEIYVQDGIGHRSPERLVYTRQYSLPLQ